MHRQIDLHLAFKLKTVSEKTSFFCQSTKVHSLLQVEVTEKSLYGTVSMLTFSISFRRCCDLEIKSGHQNWYESVKSPCKVRNVSLKIVFGKKPTKFLQSPETHQHPPFLHASCIPKARRVFLSLICQRVQQLQSLNLTGQDKFSRKYNLQFHLSSTQ